MCLVYDFMRGLWTNLEFVFGFDIIIGLNLTEIPRPRLAVTITTHKLGRLSGQYNYERSETAEKRAPQPLAAGQL